MQRRLLDPLPSLPSERPWAERISQRVRRRIESSWEFPAGLDVEPGFWSKQKNARKFYPLDVEGLSNGLYRADLMGIGISQNRDPYTDRGFVAQVISRPGTFRAKLRGLLAPRPAPEVTRGVIYELSQNSKRRQLELTRELDALGYVPEWMLTLTWPGDWRGSLGLSRGEAATAHDDLQHALAQLADLRGLITASICQHAHRNTPQSEAEVVRATAAYEAQREVVRALVDTCKRGRPDGKRIKSMMNAFLKRWDRKFGVTVEGQAPTREAALRLAEELAPYYVATRVRKLGPERYAVEAVRYRIIWWLEFQRRGAPHLHFLFYDTRGLDWDAVRRWVGPTWAAVVAGQRELNAYLAPQLADLWHQERVLWGRDLADQALRAQGLDPGIWHHVRAGTRIEPMQHRDWRYIAAETSGGSSKRYQKRVPAEYRNVGRWWGYRKYRRAPVDRITFDVRTAQDLEEFLVPVQAGVEQLPEQAFAFKAKIGRFMDAIRKGQDWGYITLWGEKARVAALEALAA